MDRLTDDEISAITALLSEDRLSTFQTMAGTTRAAIALHQQMLQLAGALMSTLRASAHLHRRRSPQTAFARSAALVNESA
ncbi:hypothetical protein GGD41_000860 [Paraburkholderia bryophila]|uniref:Uncharacterized protein n=1 Tax=Paraburkholderia bryophila TaxID=420952 RepID=A0A7Y9W3L0_9BURK|nr:hypothetical protein [Paraburkholderia bryophila]NYH13632.1 hypothetical protein [Paraburkholderia bryophila]NYH23897.1 hypothetical protein [Paraburkholderia bryophila]